MIYYWNGEIDVEGNKVIQRHYLDHSSAVDSEQDSEHSLAVFETICHWLRKKEKFRHIKNIWINSDNANNYASNAFVAGTMLIAEQYSLALYGIFYTESQDGKNELDAHFAHSNIRLKNFMMRNNLDLDSPYRMYQGLTEGRGLTNSTIFYFHFERDLTKTSKTIRCNKERLSECCSEIFNCTIERNTL